MKGFIKYYILLIVFQVAHTLEEIFSKFSFIESFFKGLNNFIIAQVVFWTIPIVLLYLVINKNKVAYNLSYLYASILVVDGFYHLWFLSKGEYIGTLGAGAYTGIGLIIFGALLFYNLLKNK